MRALARLATCLGAAASASGCSLSGVIDHDIADYYDTASTANNRLLLLNVLRARDKAPLHFSELSVVHGVVQASAGLTAAFPVGGSLLNAFRDAVTPTASIQSSPTFDLGTLETQEFTKGIMTPVDPKVIRQFLDSGLDYRIVLMLFFADVTLPPADGDPSGSPRTLHNSMTCARRSDAESSRLTCDPQMFGYLRFTNEIGSLEPHAFKPAPTLVGPPLALRGDDALKAIAALNPAQYVLKPAKPGYYQAFAPSSDVSVAFCIGPDPDLAAKRLKYRDAVGTYMDPSSGPVNYLVQQGGVGRLPSAKGAYDCARGKPPEASAPGTPEGPTQALTTRSVFGMIEYLGGILEYQEKNRGRCITLGIPANGSACDKEDVLFRLDGRAGRPALKVRYASADYAVALPDGCQSRRDEAAPCDHTLEVLSVVSTLLNMNKVAKDIPATPSVQVVP